MKVLVTGAFGNIGHHTVTELLRKGHQVRCFDLDNKTNRRMAGRFKGRVETLWGDVARRPDVEAAVKGQDVVIHLAFNVNVVWSEAHPDEARKVNVGGTINVIEAMKARVSQGRKLIFTSSISAWGDTSGAVGRPLRASDPVKPNNVYGRHKVECEELVKSSGLDWCVLRVALAFSPRGGRIEDAGLIFEIPLDAHVDFVAPPDVGLAIANSVTSSEVWRKTLPIGGGSRNQMLYRDFVAVFSGSLGLGRLPEEAFAPPDASVWACVDSSEGQRLLNYQNHSLEDYIKGELAAMAPGLGRYVLPLVAPMLRCQLLKQSRYYRASKQRVGGSTL